MKDKLEDHISNISKSLKEINDTDLFGVADEFYNNLEKNCVDYLKFLGYSVFKPEIPEYSVTKIDDVINYFENRKSFMFPNKIRASNNSYIKNQVGINRLIKKIAEANNINRRQAMREFCAIVDTVFDNYDQFGFKFDITLSCLINNKFWWVIEKATKIKNEAIEKNKTECINTKFNEFEDSTAEDDVVEDDELDFILKSMEA